MNFNIFSIIIVLAYLLIFIYSFLKKDNKYTIFNKLFVIYMFIEINVGVGFFIKVGTFEFLYSELALAILFIYTMIVCIKSGINARLLGYAIVFLLSIILSMLFCFLFKYNIKIISFSGSWDKYIYLSEILSYPKISINSFLTLIRIVMYIFLILFSVNHLRKLDTRMYVLKYNLKLIKILLLIVLIEFILKYTGNGAIYVNATSKIFGITDGTYTKILYRSGYPCIQGLQKEPSILAISMFFDGLIIILYGKTHINKYIFVLTIIISLLSLSLSSIIFSLSSIILYFLYDHNVNFIRLIISIIFLIVFIFGTMNIPYFNTRINSTLKTINSVMHGTSIDISIQSGEIPRIVSILYNWQYFFKYPLFGLGLSTTYSHSFIPSILANIGILGTISWFIFSKYAFNLKKMNYLILIVIILLFSFQGLYGTFYSVCESYLIFQILSNKNTKEISIL